MGCTHTNRKIQRVQFKNGTQHAQESCINCGAKVRFVPKHEIAKFEDLETGTTTREFRNAVGLWNGCFSCGTPKPGPRGICRTCRQDPHNKAFLAELKRRGLNIWKISKEQALEIIGEIKL